MPASNVLDGVAYLMHDAELHGRMWKYALDGIREALQSVYAAYHDILHTTVLQVCKHFQPEVGTLTPGHVHAQHMVDGTSDGTPIVVLYLVMDRIKPADCIDRLQGATLPFLYFWQYTVCYCTEGLGRQSGIELTLKVTADLTGTGTKGLHTDNLVRHTLCKNRLTLADCLRIKTAITVTRGIYSHLAILCLNSL